MKVLITKQSSVVFFLLMILMLFGPYNIGYGQDKGQAETINPPLSERTPQIRDAIVAAVPGVNAAADVTAAHLAAISRLDASKKSITALKSGDFSGLTALTNLYLYENAISDISALKDLTSLTRLYLYDNAISDISPLENLTSLTRLELYDNAISDISALEDLTSLTNLWLFSNAISDISVLENLTSLTDLWLTGNSISNISALEDLTSLTDLFLESNSISDTSPLEGLTNLTRLHLKGNPISDYGPVRRLKAAIEAAGSDIYIDVDIGNKPPVFTEGPSATRTIAENTPSGQNIGTPIDATDVDGDTLTCTLSGTDAVAFSIVNTNGQLRTRAALDFETKNSYSVTVDVSDGNGGSDSIPVTINVTNVNEAPSFATTTATRSIAENTGANTNIGDPFTATDVDANTTLAYTLDGTDAASFSINSTNGQLRTSAALDYEKKTSYTVRITVSDSELTDTIDVTINVTNVDENRAPSFTDGSTATRSVAENTGSGQNIGGAVSATDPDDDTLTYTLSGADAGSFSINSTNGQLKTKAALDYETKNEYTVTVSVSDGNGGTDIITVTINVTNVNEIDPPLSERTQQVRDAIVAAVPGVNNADDVTVAHLAAITQLNLSDQSITALKSGDFNELPALEELYLESNSISDISALEELTALTTLNLWGNSISDISALEELTALEELNLWGNSISDISALEGLTALKYLYLSGNSISDISALEELTALEELNLSGNSISDISALAGLTALEELNLSGNSISDISTLADLTALTMLYLNGNSISNISALSGLTALTYLYLDGNPISNYGPLRRLLAAIDGIEDHQGLTLDINIPPVFTEGTDTRRSVAENTASGQNIGDAVSATDADNDTLTYTLSGTEASSFSINSTNGQLRTSAALDYEAKTTYSVTVEISDGNGGSDSIDVTINVSNVNEAPSFASTTATRSVAENTTANTDIGSAITATDSDTGDTLTYTLGGTDKDSFSISGTTGQLQTNAALDFETKTSYTVRITVSDSELTDTIDVSINVTNVNEAPSFATTTATRTIAENKASAKIGTAVTATDVDANTTLTYTLTGTDAASFSIVSTNGQLRTRAALNYETKTSYTVTITVSDSELTDTIDVTIDVTDVYEPIIHRTQQIQDAIVAAVPGVNHADYVTVAHLAAITNLNLSDKSITSLKSGDFNELPALTNLNLWGNSISDISALAGLPALKYLYLWGNSISDISVLAGLTKLTKLDLSGNSISDISALAGLTKLTELNLSGNSIGDISALAGLTKLTKLDLDGNSISDISALAGLTALTNLSLAGTSISDISTLAGLTALERLNLLHNTSLSDISALAGLTALRYLHLNGNSISNISALAGLTALTTLDLLNNPISDYEPLRRLLAAIDAIEDHEGLTLDINIPPAFTEGTDTTRAVAEYTPSAQDIGDPVSATDVDNDYLTYSLEGTDADAFSIDPATGQLQTSAALNYQTKRSYSVTVSVSDGYDGTDSIAVRIYVTDVNEAGITPVDRRTQEVQDAIMRAVRVDNAADVTYTDLAAINYLYLSSKGITSLKSGDFSGLPALTDLDLSVNSISNISALSGLTKLTELNLFSNSISNISVLSGLPALTDLNLSDNSISNISVLSGLPALTDLNLSDNSISNISVLSGLTALTELHLDGNSISNISALERLTALRYLYLWGNPISNYEPLRKLLAAIEGHPGLTLDINIPPLFTEGTYTTRSVAEYTLSEKDIGDPVSATDANENDSLTYTLEDKDVEGTDAASFNIDSPTGQLRTLAPLNYQTKRSYSVTVSVSDGNGGTDRITVRINVTDVDESRITPVNQRTQQVQDAIVRRAHTADNADDVTVGHLTAITDLSLSYDDITSLKSGDFSGLPALTYLTLTGNSISDISALADLTALEKLYLNENFVSDISALEGITSLTEIYLSGNSISDVSALEGLTNLTYLTLSGNPISDYVPLRRLETAIQNADNSISIDINITNNPPQFTEGGSTTRSIAENTESYTDIGEPISATDADPSDNLSYIFAPDRFGGSDARLFSIDYSTGQLRTSEDLDYEEQTSYTVVVEVFDSSDGLDRITVTINITDVAGAAPSVETSPIIPENTALLTNFPNPFNPETWIPYQLAKPAEVTLTIYDIRGVVVRELKLGHQPAGVYHNRSRAIHWDGRNAFGEKVATGVYFYTLKAGDFTATRKLLIRK